MNRTFSLRFPSTLIVVSFSCLVLLLFFSYYYTSSPSWPAYAEVIQGQWKGLSSDRKLASRLAKIVQSLGLDLEAEYLLNDKLFLDVLQQIEDYRLRMEGDLIETWRSASEDSSGSFGRDSPLPNWIRSSSPVERENNTYWYLWDVFTFRENRFIIIQGPDRSYYGNGSDIEYQCRFEHPSLGTIAQVVTATPVYPNLHHFAIRCPLPTQFTAMLNDVSKSSNDLALKFDLVSMNASFLGLPILPPLNTQRHFLSAYTMFRSPARRLPEWIEFHRMMGIEHFYIYDHIWEIETDSVLAPYIERGLVTIVRWRFALNDTWFNSIQSVSMNNALWRFGEFNKWMCFIDADEYLIPQRSHEDSLLPLLKEFSNASEAMGALRIRSVIFSDIFAKAQMRIPPGLLIEQFSYREVTPNPLDRQKLILRPKSVFAMQNVHGLSYGPIMEEIPTDRLLLYHYWSDGRLMQNNPAQFDFTARRFVQKLKTRLFRFAFVKRKL